MGSFRKLGRQNVIDASVKYNVLIPETALIAFERIAVIN